MEKRGKSKACKKEDRKKKVGSIREKLLRWRESKVKKTLKTKTTQDPPPPTESSSRDVVNSAPKIDKSGGRKTNTGCTEKRN